MSGQNPQWSGRMSELHGTEISMQAVVTVAAAVDAQEGANRRSEINAMHPIDASRIIGSVNLSENDPLLTIHKFDPMLIRTDTVEYSSVDSGDLFDSRATVVSALNGIVVPDHVRSELEWRRLWKNAGFSMNDYYTTDSRQIQHGVGLYAGGAIGGLPHRAPEPWMFCDYLYQEIPPYDPVKREAWALEMHTDYNTNLPGVMKSVLRKWSPTQAIELLETSIDSFWGTAEWARHTFEELQPNSMAGLQQREYQTALLKGRSVLWNAFVGAIVLEEFGLCVLKDPKGIPAYATHSTNLTEVLKSKFWDKDGTYSHSDLTNDDKDDRTRIRETIAKSLGLYEDGLPGNRHNGLIGRLIGVTLQPVFSSSEHRDRMSSTSLFPRSDVAIKDGFGYQMVRLQHDAYIGDCMHTFDIYGQHASSVVARCANNSEKRDNADIIIAF